MKEMSIERARDIAENGYEINESESWGDSADCIIKKAVYRRAAKALYKHIRFLEDCLHTDATWEPSKEHGEPYMFHNCDVKDELSVSAPGARCMCGAVCPERE